jgi:hypothetical protein
VLQTSRVLGKAADSGARSAKEHESGFSTSQLEALQATKMIKLRSGETHRPTWMWVVVVNGRVFVRSWNDAPTGWYRALRAEPLGTLEVGGRQIAIRAEAVRGTRALDAVDAAYAKKYVTRANLKYVEGFREKRRRKTTTELVAREARETRGPHSRGGRR